MSTASPKAWVLRWRITSSEPGVGPNQRGGSAAIREKRERGRPMAAPALLLASQGAGYFDTMIEVTRFSDGS